MAEPWRPPGCYGGRVSEEVIGTIEPGTGSAWTSRNRKCMHLGPCPPIRQAERQSASGLAVLTYLLSAATVVYLLGGRPENAALMGAGMLLSLLTWAWVTR